jgi:ABC-2 type transport system ATP-binding protein
MIQLKNIIKKYNNKIVLGPINLNIILGEKIAIVGANGSGKSTLCEIIAGSKKSTSGSINYQIDRTSLYKKLSISFQDQHYPRMAKVKDFLNFYKSVYEKDINQEKFQILEKKLKIEQLKNYFIYKLSGGEKQRFCLFISLCYEPTFFIGDEITNNLDVETSLDIINFLKEEIEKNKMTLCLVSHNWEEIKNLCKRIIFLKKGKIIDDTNIETIKNKYNSSLLEYFQEMNQTK